MHKFAVIHKPSNVVCYSANRVNHCAVPNDNYEIVSLDSTNASKFTNVTCDLTLGSYAEIVAALSGGFIGFYTDADDNMFISNEFRTINIPGLMFQELCLDVEEVAFGDVCDLLDDDETAAYEATHKWVASRLLSTDTTDTKMSTPEMSTPEMSTPEMSTPEMSTPEMSTVFKKAFNLPLVITFAHDVDNSPEYSGCPRVVASCEDFDFKAAQTGYRYDMIGALMSDFINSNCTQYAIQCVYVFNELRGGYNCIHTLNSGKFYINAGCTYDVESFFDDVGLHIKFTRSKHGEIVSAVIYK